MATYINITNKIKNEQKFITLGEKHYKVDDSKNTMVKVMAMFDNGGNDVAQMEQALEMLLGKEAKADIDALNLNMEDYRVPFIAVMACVTGKTYEQTEADFRDF